MKKVTQFMNFGWPVKMTVMPNGLTVYVLESYSDIVRINIAFKVGKAQNKLAETAHFLEHLVAGSAASVSNKETKTLYSKGCYFNAGSSEFSTFYVTEGLIDDFGFMLKQLVELISNFEISDKDVEQEKTIIKQEVHQGLVTSSRQLYISRKRKLFPHLPMLSISPNQNMAEIDAINKDILMEMFNNYYCLNNAALIVTGGISYEQVIGTLIAHQLNLPKGTHNQINFMSPRIGRYDFNVNNMTSVCDLYFKTPVSRIDTNIIHFIFNLLSIKIFGLLWAKLRAEDGIVYELNPGVAVYPQLISSMTIPVAVEHFKYVEEQFQIAINRIIQGDYSDDLFECVQSYLLFILARRKDYDHEKIFDDIKTYWMRSIKRDIDLKKLFTEITKEDVSRVAEKYIKGKYGRIAVFPS